MTALLERLLSVPAIWVYAVVVTLVVVEDALFVGFVVPAETAVVLGGVAASQGHGDVWLLGALVVAAAVVGDSLGYEVGRRFGPRLLAGRLARRHQQGIDAASDTLARRGGPAVFLARLTAFLRAVTPALAGAARMRYRTFLAWNAVGGLVWGVGAVLLGYLAGASWETVASKVGTTGAVVAAVVVVAVVVAWKVRGRRSRKRSGDAARADVAPLVDAGDGDRTAADAGVHHLPVADVHADVAHR
ncbi:SNARE associated Golgi protein [Klenkia taihuensis]|uniref:SNARE associated Golgi protein n=1 Tax=Klenkia taihuensis TaxID=1225127 RepID=A0A1I1HL02_9ACTN|nr:SNARE associated Golgi protein [Klenkia taihuensis]